MITLLAIYGIGFGALNLLMLGLGLYVKLKK